MSFDNNLVLVFCPFLLADVRVQVIMPALTALLANASWQVLRNETPVLRAIILHKPQHQLIFFRSLY